MAGTIVVDRIESDSSYASTINVASQINLAGGVQLGGQTANFGVRNRIINGGMAIWQRNGTISNTPSSGSSSPFLDRWKLVYDAGGKMTVGQTSSIVPPNQSYAMSITVASAHTPTSGQEFRVQQGLEGFSIGDLGWGTQYAAPVTLSFWVRSSKIGVYCATLQATGANRVYVSEYTINQANTWEYKTITVPGCTDGTWNINSSLGVNIFFQLAAGSTYYNSANTWTTNTSARCTSNQVNWLDTLGATFYLSGVQFERGTVATGFEQRPMAMELQMCQRYCYVTRYTKTNTQAWLGVGVASAATTSRVHYNLPVELRIPPVTFTVSDPAHYYFNNMGPGGGTCTSITLNSADEMHMRFLLDGQAGMTAGYAGEFNSQSTSAYMIFDSEL